MSFSGVRQDCAEINGTLDAIEFRLLKIENRLLRIKLAELEAQTASMVSLPPIQVSATFDGDLDGNLSADVSVQ